MSYHASEKEINEILSKVNGVYIAGDSQESLLSDDYQKTFQYILHFVEQATKKNDEYFPMFLMGKSLQSYARAKATNPFTIRDMNKGDVNLKNTNMQIELLQEPEETFLLSELT